MEEPKPNSPAVTPPADDADARLEALAETGAGTEDESQTTRRAVKKAIVASGGVVKEPALESKED